MNISHNWLNDLIEIDLPPDKIADELTRVGLAVEGIHPHKDDFVFDIDLTSNRPDCLSHLGIARELKVITNSQLLVNESENPEVPMPAILTPDFVKIDDSRLCRRFTARIITNVKIGPSPQWLVDRLEAIGERSINNVADITNYVMHELGQPMHSFDLDKLTEKRIIVRRAKNGETITTLDEVERKLDESMLAICDADKPVAVAGIMGGLDSSITEGTVNVLLEVAFFQKENIHQTSRKLGLSTEASYRFERGVDIENLKRASDRAAELIRDLAGGEHGEFIDVYPSRYTPNEVESADIWAAVKRLTGLSVDTTEANRFLTALGIEQQREGVYVSPSWRHDVLIEEDLVEEVARHAGYENIGTALPPAYGAGEYQHSEVRKKLLRQTLVDQRFDEALSYSFIDKKFDDVFGVIPNLIDGNSEETFVTLNDSVMEGAVRMRPTLLPGLLEAVRLNFNHQRRDVSLFEVGKVFAAKTSRDNLPTERELFSIAVTGSERYENWSMPGRELDFYDAKGSVEAAIEAVGVAGLDFADASFKHLRKGQSASISLNGKGVGSLGRLNEEISADFKFKQPVYVAELDLQTILAETQRPILYKALPKYPSVVRDVSLLVKRTMTFGEIRETIISQGSEICRSIDFVDIYEGKGMKVDERSITIRLEYRSDERTLIEEEVAAVHKGIVTILENTLGIKQRY
ncbi:MAG: phenylalanine--tRNA ligase subunit beta [Pyrinomonadaceae bacterium]